MGSEAGGPGTPSLGEIARQWLRIGVTGFGGPPAHIALLRQLCVDRRGWVPEEEFERGIAATSLLPGPASTQLAIYCAWRVRGASAAIIGGLAFIVPGLVAVLALSAAFLNSAPPLLLRGAAAGAGAAVAAVALHAGWSLAPPIWRRSEGRRRPRVLVYALVGTVAAAASTPWLVLVLVGCGAAEFAAERAESRRALDIQGMPLLLAAAGSGGIGALAWTALKVGALSFGGGFVIIPLMQGDAVHVHHWMTAPQFLDAVVLGQITPGPVVNTVAAVGYAAAGVGGGLLAAAIAFAPSFLFVLAGAGHFNRLLGGRGARAALAGCAPAAIGAIVGSSVPLARALSEGWQYVVLALAVLALLVLRRGVVGTLLTAALIGLLAAVAGFPLPA